MKLECYVIKDEKADAFLQPFFTLNEVTAKRAIAGLLMEANQFAKFPEDFSLWYMCDYDDTSGSFFNVDIRKHVCNLADLKSVNNVEIVQEDE